MGFAIEGIALALYRLWRQAFQLSPRWTLASTIVLGVILVIGITWSDQQRSAEIARAREARLSSSAVSQRIDDLNRTKASLQDLIAFVDEQRAQIDNEQQTLERLQRERADLEPVVGAQRQVIDEIFQIQEERASRDQRWNLSVGFVLGVLGSLIASLIIMAGQRVAQRRGE